VSQPAPKRYPIVGVAVVIRDQEGRVLLGRRAQGRNAGKWCIPCGRLEWGEDVRAGALRELLEETGLEARINAIAAVHSNFHNPDDLSVGIWFHGEVTGGHLHCPDGELSEVGYFAPDAPPEMAFPTDEIVLAELASAHS
jgi:ADP-ribose pyrophosphatase YjhB (NUDIX family)